LTGAEKSPLLQNAIMKEQLKFWPPTEIYSFTEKLYLAKERLLEVEADIMQDTHCDLVSIRK
jgi:hypothetical protein